MLTPAGLDQSVGLVTGQYYKNATDPQWKDDPSMLEWRAFMPGLLRPGIAMNTGPTDHAPVSHRSWPGSRASSGSCSEKCSVVRVDDAS